MYKDDETRNILSLDFAKKVVSYVKRNGRKYSDDTSKKKVANKPVEHLWFGATGYVKTTDIILKKICDDNKK